MLVALSVVVLEIADANKPADDYFTRYLVLWLLEIAASERWTMQTNKAPSALLNTLETLGHRKV